MGQVTYAHITLPRQELYREDAMHALGSLFDIGINECGRSGEQVADAFIASGLAREFERCNPVFVAGMSELELFDRIAESLGVRVRDIPRNPRQPTVDYWVGWSLASFQIETGRAYRTVFERVRYSELAGMYHPLHEAPESKFVHVLSELIAQRRQQTRLATVRKAAGLSQEQLARLSGVGLRSIQMYEQRNKDINKAQAASILSLATALGCQMEDLLGR
jgi:DNA-binding transcriptional regulator YiaG